MLVLVRHADDPEPLIAEGVWHGTIVDAPRGDGGFGYDPHFVDAATGLTGAELPLAQKNELSHRGKAMRALLARLDAKQQAHAMSVGRPQRDSPRPQRLRAG